MKKSTFFSFALMLFTTSLLLGQEATPLALNQSVEKEITADGKQVFTLKLKKDRFVYGEAYQHSADVIITVLDPAGKGLGVYDVSARGVDAFQFNSAQAGLYRIEITPFEQASGRFSLQILQAEPIATTPEGKVDQLMAQYSGEKPGGSIVVTQNGKIIFAKGYGLANLEYDIPNTPQTVFHQASISKQFTAFAIAMLAEQGKLSLDDEVQKYLPNLPDFGEKITLRHLLNHTSGIRDHWSLWTMAGGRMDDVIRQEDIRRLLELQQELNFSPGAEFLYSNSGFMLLSEVVTQVSGQPFGEWMQENVFAPLKMDHTQIYDDHERTVPGRAYSYQSGDPGYKKSVLSYANSGATSLFTTAEDMALWLKNFKTMEVGGPAVMKQMLERGILTNGDTLDYALGLFIGNYKGLRTIGHGGADAGFRSNITYFPEIDAGIAVMGNIGSFNPNQITNEVADAFFEKNLETKKEPAPAPQSETDAADLTLSAEVLDRYVGDFIFDNGPQVRLFREGEEFFTQIDGQSKFRLQALSDTLFKVIVPGWDASLSFHLEEDGHVERAFVYQNGGTQSLRRVEAWTPVPDALTAFTGSYFSPELETLYHVKLVDSQLIVHHRRHGDIELKPLEKDAFQGNQWFFGETKFIRNEAGDITGMRVSNGRVRNLLLEKQ